MHSTALYAQRPYLWEPNFICFALIGLAAGEYVVFLGALRWIQIKSRDLLTVLCPSIAGYESRKAEQKC